MKTKIVSFLSSVGGLILSFIGGSCGIACLAGGCCGGIVLLGFIGLLGSSLRFLEKLIPVFLTLTIISLGYAFYKAYKPEPAGQNESNNNLLKDFNSKEKKKHFLKSKAFLWIVTIICAVMWIYPVFSNNEIKSQTVAPCCPSGLIIDSLQCEETNKKQTTACCPPSSLSDSLSVPDATKEQPVKCCPSTK